MKTVFTLAESGENLESLEYNFQDVLTPVLDNTEGDFDQNIINQIVLWKVNRYASVDSSALILLNTLKKEAVDFDENFTRKILEKLLTTKGIRLPMASTILRFKNPNVYQIIDQRVYRIIKGVPIKTPYAIKEQIEFYIDYLNALRAVCVKFKIDFKNSDRILYELDKKHNAEIKLNNY